MISFLDSSKTKKTRRHNYRSECGIFGPEFVNVLCAVDSTGHYYAKCVCFGPMSKKELLDLESKIQYSPSKNSRSQKQITQLKK